MVPIPKKRRSGVCKTDEFREISLVPVAYKAMCSVIQGRLRHVVEERNLVAKEQGGLRKRRICRDQLLTLVLLGQVKQWLKEGCWQVLLTLRRPMTEWIEGSYGAVWSKWESDLEVESQPS